MGGGELSRGSRASAPWIRRSAARGRGMRERHWEELSEVVGEEVSPSMSGDFTLKRFVDMGLLTHTPDIAAIGDKAGRRGPKCTQRAV